MKLIPSSYNCLQSGHHNEAPINAKNMAVVMPPGIKLSPIPSSNCFAFALLLLLFQLIR